MKAFYLVCITCLICSIETRSISNDAIRSIESVVASESSLMTSDTRGLLGKNVFNDSKDFHRRKRQIFRVDKCPYGTCRRWLGGTTICGSCKGQM